MKILSFTCIIAVVGVMFTQAGPIAKASSENITSMTFSNAQGLYDLTGFITGFDMTGTYHNTDYEISADVSIVQSITGAFTAGTTGTVLSVNANGSVDVPVAYTLKGTLSSKGAKPTGTLNFSCKGTYLGGNNETTTYHDSETLLSIFTLDPATGKVTGQTTGTFSKSPSSVGTAKLSAVPLLPSPLTPMAWSLHLSNLTTTGTKVTGNATVNLLGNGRSFPFTVKGTSSAKTGTAKLTLTGTTTNGTDCTDSGKGATLSVTMTNNASITGITGSLLGQKISVK